MPVDHSYLFDVEKIARLTDIYDQDFSIIDCSSMDQFDTFTWRVHDFRAGHDFALAGAEPQFKMSLEKLHSKLALTCLVF